MHSAQSNAELFTKMQKYHTLALAKLATATQSDSILVALLAKTISEISGQVALLAKTISEISGQVALLTAKIATAQAENAQMKKLGQQSTTARHGYQVSSNSTPLDLNSSQYRNLYSRSGHRFNPNGCCSSHGYKVEESHTSATCRFPNNGHNKSAT